MAVLKAAQLVSSEELETAKFKISELTQLKNKTTKVNPLYCVQVSSVNFDLCCIRSYTCMYVRMYIFVYVHTSK